MHDNRRTRPTFDPHFYQPLVIDEGCLSAADCGEAVRDAVVRPCDWKSFLTPKELEALEKALVETEKLRSPNYYCPFEMFETREKRSEAARLGTFRAYARDKYADGQRFWFGDGVPFR